MPKKAADARIEFRARADVKARIAADADEKDMTVAEFLLWLHAEYERKKPTKAT